MVVRDLIGPDEGCEGKLAYSMSEVETCREDVCGSTLDIAKGERPSDGLSIQGHDTRSDCCCCPMLGRFVAVDDEGASTPTETAETMEYVEITISS